MDRIQARLSECDFWDKMSDEEKSQMLANTRLATYRKSDIVHSADDRCEGMIFVLSGVLRVYMMSEGGREVTLYRLRSGENCILSASCVLEKITFDVFIVAEEETEVVLVNSATFKELLDSNIHVKNYAYMLSTERFSDVMWAMQQVLFMGIDKRLAIYLWDEYALTQSPTIKATQESIAASIGSAREVVSRMLKYFVEEGIVQVSRGAITITDMEKLKKLTE